MVLMVNMVMVVMKMMVVVMVKIMVKVMVVIMMMLREKKTYTFNSRPSRGRLATFP